jgi:hypothetical protein
MATNGNTETASNSKTDPLTNQSDAAAAEQEAKMIDDDEQDAEMLEDEPALYRRAWSPVENPPSPHPGEGACPIPSDLVEIGKMIDEGD